MIFPYRTTCLRACLVALLSLGSVNAAPSAQTGRHERLPAVWPPPQHISSSGGGVSLNGPVTIVTGNVTDLATINTIKAAVLSAGGHAIVSSQSTGQGTQIVIGTEAENSAAAAIAKALTGKPADGLAADGYVLASGDYEHRPTIVLNGVDGRGTFYASQTLRQLVVGHHVPGVQVRDWPLMSIRGSIEGFYGVPWSHQARLDQLVFYGKHKMNTYVYTPKDDPLLRAKWRTLYNGTAYTQLKELVKTANTNHVDFTFALSPGLDVCYSSNADFNATITKFNQARQLGVRSFYIALDDIPLEFHCAADQKRWNTTGNRDNYHWLANSQAYYLNRIQKEYIEPNGLNNLETVPTNYAGSAPDPYKEEFGTRLDKNIRVQWTGEGVFSDQINATSVQQADSTYVTDNLFLWDNFPVNDGNRDRLFLNPLTGRAADLYKYLLGFTSNPMEEAYASMPALANYGDYTWNGPAYNADESMAAILWELSGSDPVVHDAVLAFSDLNQNWPYRTPAVSSPELNKDIAAFWAARKHSPGHGHGNTLALHNRLALLTTLPDVLPRMAMKSFASDVAPWSTVAMQWAHACQHLIAMLDAVDAGDKKRADGEFNAAQAWVKKTKAKTVNDRNDDGQDLPDSITPHTAEEAFTTFLANATTIYKSQ
ncbi:beta-N-acetylglucosaminidase-domain-containing protein [Penicillium riverlandense]|uniref:beta-N-acetylglucosaminidase-domain-containing protein n=1 Tax=Penicillium riverlandense TaxID=1903569 RepID=UPI0025474765|nr:beta-N-acetylglucosaminidase-domain-containing protein [Penicillium riverlandense]KAJ5806783.1 beta-N-acetylglucosaminidase-domain-containing protein [Penicillium riverlandense]